MLRKVLGIVVPVCALLGVLGLMIFAAQGASMPVVDTRGVIADQQRDIFYSAIAIMMIIVLPVFFLVVFISIRYRAGNKKALYKPEWATHRGLETVWWGVPILIVGVLSVLVWNTSHSLDPFRPLASTQAPLKIEVIALQWKWLFIYPDQQVASVGEFAMPINRPVEFTITSDAPMNSFWIPQLGGQIYAMSGMSTKLHLSARESGDYRGFSANLSGKGHASMTFTAKARSVSDFNSWIQASKKSAVELDAAKYELLRLPSLQDGVAHYRLTEPKLYQQTVERYSSSHTMTGHSHDTVSEATH